jgi:hypothetical protein
VPDLVARSLAALLVVVHAGLGAWAAVGFVELGFQHVPWPRVSNPLFSRPMLLLQWTLIATASAVFIAGYFRRWQHTPVAMLGIYGAMALTCAYQTFFVLTAPSRFRAMAIEYTEYALILAFLFFSSHMRARFS